MTNLLVTVVDRLLIALLYLEYIGFIISNSKGSLGVITFLARISVGGELGVPFVSNIQSAAHISMYLLTAQISYVVLNFSNIVDKFIG